ncbi:hypothetical protein [Mycolicibacterium sp.]|jgi:hypothetical protein|uniref:hypothetical protein n=1 Tax=Mycolicibacterium sp. TaxID=2320850 RepID=UPI0028AC57D5|nr:hypothetical protein [Mycolicibacterium sp.]
MTGFGNAAMNAAPIAGGAMLGALAGNIKGPDFRAIIKSDIELLDSLPEESVEVRAALQQSIETRVYELIAQVDRNRELRQAASGYQGNWRDIFVFLCAVLFTIVWWNVPHSRNNWTLTFVVMVILSVVVGLYAARGFINLFRGWLRRN